MHHCTFLPVPHGVPQGSVFGPLLFVLYTSYISRIAHERGLRCQCYANTQLYFHIKPNETTVANSILESCISDIHKWLARNRLQLNPGKTELVWCSSARCVSSFVQTSVSVDGSIIIRATDRVRDLGVIIWTDMSMNDQISAVVRSCYLLQ